MSVTLLQLEEVAEQALGAKHDGRFDLTALVNEAGRYLVAMHPWAWRMRPAASVSLTGDVGYVALPSDFGFGEVLEVVQSNGWMRLCPVALARLEVWRRQTSSSRPTHYAVAHPGQASSSAAPPNPRLELWPTPAEDEADALRVTYRAGWTALDDITDAANVPPTFETALRMAVRAVALERAGDPRALGELPMSPVIETLRRADAGVQPQLGTMRGGHLETLGLTGWPGGEYERFIPWR